MKVLILSLFLASCASTKDELCPPDDLTCPRQKFREDEHVKVRSNPALDSKMPMNNPAGETSATPQPTNTMPVNDNPIPPTDMEMK